MNRKLKLIILVISLCIIVLLALGFVLARRMIDTTGRLDQLAARSDAVAEKISRVVDAAAADTDRPDAAAADHTADADRADAGQTTGINKEEAETVSTETAGQAGGLKAGRKTDESETPDEAAGTETDEMDEAERDRTPRESVFGKPGEDMTEPETETGFNLPHHVIFVGDSRTVGMGKAEIQTGDECIYIGESGEGYDWFTETGINLLDEAIRAYPDDPVIYNLGVNDCDAINAYIEVYHDMEKAYPDTDFYYMSVNPVTDDSLLVPNSDIIVFNRKLRSAFPDQYIDTYSWMVSDGFEDVDGVHYSEEQYCMIHDFAVRHLPAKNLAGSEKQTETGRQTGSTRLTETNRQSGSTQLTETGRQSGSTRLTETDRQTGSTRPTD